MKKILLTFIFGLIAMIGIQGQTAIQTSNALDNIYVGIGGGVSTPLDFNSVFPLNAMGKLTIGKEITPEIAVEAEGIAAFNDNHYIPAKTFVKATNVGGNVVFNLSNMFGDYKGKPRVLEFKLNAGLGWMHSFNDVDGYTKNFLTSKTGADIALNIGKTRAVSLIFTPAIYWNLSASDEQLNKIKFNKHNAQASLTATLVYHFKTSNGTRYFKTYDVGAMLTEINHLNKQLETKPKVVEVVKFVEKPEKPRPTAAFGNRFKKADYVFFSQGSAELTDAAKEVLDKVMPGKYDIKGYCSPEGTVERNNTLSLLRAEAVSEYLKNKKGIIINSVEGCGADSDASNRVVIISPVK